MQFLWTNIVCLCLFLFLNVSQGLADYLISDTVVAVLPQQKIEALRSLEDKVVGSLEGVLDDNQEEILKEALTKGNLRKAFKQINLTEAQRVQIGEIFKILPQSEEFMSLTPDQKKQFFMRKKELFIPSAEEIAAKVKQNMEMIGTKRNFVPSAAGILEVVKEKIGIKENFMPSKEEISEKVKRGLEIKGQFMENSALNDALQSVDQLLEEKRGK